MNGFVIFLDKLPDIRRELIIATARLGLQAVHVSLTEFLKGQAALPSSLHAAVISTYLSGLDDIFRAIRKLKNANIFRIVIHPLTILPGSVVLDFEDLGADVLSPAPTMEQFEQCFAVRDAAEARIARRGVTVHLLGSTDPLISGSHRGRRKYKLGNGRLRPIFFQLVAAANKAVATRDLALVAKCSYGHVKVYIQRLRKRYEMARRELGLNISGCDFIEETEGGYRLNAQIKRP